MTAFRFIYPDDDEGFELVEEVETSAESDDEDEESAQSNNDDVIWELTED